MGTSRRYYFLFAGTAIGAACDLSTGGTLPEDSGAPDVTIDVFIQPDVIVDDVTPPEAGSDVDAAPGCTSTKGPPMVQVEDFCVDTTEVTEAQYAEFLAADSGVSGLPPRCVGKSTYVPLFWDDGGAPNHPVDYVDWCDAWAFCAYAGKRLCGSPKGGPVEDGSAGQWEVACSAKGTRSYCYGNVWNPAACNVKTDGGANAKTPVTSFPGCIGGYPGLSDMTGNVAEWIDRCPGTNCAYHASDYTATAGATCDKQGLASNALQRLQGVGFRCCR